MAEDKFASRTPLRLADTMDGKPAYGLCLLIMLLHLVDGFDMQLLGVTVNAISADWKLPASSFSAAMAGGHAGAAIGAIMGGYLGDRVGRKPIIVGGVLIFSLASFAMAFVTTPSELALLRVVAGIGLGGCLPPALALLTETMPQRLRGLSISLVMLCFPLGIALAGFLAIAVIPGSGWRSMFLLGGAIPLGFALILFFALKDPSHNRRQEEIQDRSSIMGRLLTGDESAKLLPLLGVFFCCYFATNMILSWLPTLMAHIGVRSEMTSGAISVWSLAGMPGVIVAGLIMTRWGIRRGAAIYIGGGILALISIALAAANEDASAAGLSLLVPIAFGGFMLSGTITTIFAYCTDIFAPEIRSSAIGLSATAGRVGAIVGAASGAMLLEFGGALGFFGMAAGMFAFALLLFMVALAALRRREAAAA